MPLSAILFICLASLLHQANIPPPTVRLANFGVGDTLFIVVIALIVFGPKKLPEISRQLGKLLYEFRKASNDFKFQIEEELRAVEQAERQKQLDQQAALSQPATPVTLAAGQTVSAAPEPDTDTSANTAESSTAPAIQPPSTGAPVSTRSPYRPQSEPEQNESLDEQQASAQEAIDHAAAEQASAPTHHG
jgi:sec-independent protein translocase protein TatB